MFQTSFSTHSPVTFLLSNINSETKIIQILLDCIIISEVIWSAQTHDVYDDPFYIGCEHVKRDHLCNFLYNDVRLRGCLAKDNPVRQDL